MRERGIVDITGTVECMEERKTNIFQKIKFLFFDISATNSSGIVIICEFFTIRAPLHEFFTRMATRLKIVLIISHS